MTIRQLRKGEDLLRLDLHTRIEFRWVFHPMHYQKVVALSVTVKGGSWACGCRDGAGSGSVVKRSGRFIAGRLASVSGGSIRGGIAVVE